MSEDSNFSIDITLSPPVETRRESLIGATLGGFRLTRLLGTGGMGSVYLGEHQVIGSKVAVKVLHPELSANSQQVERFHAEARAVNLIDHENIVKIFDLSVDPQGRHYFVMEYLDGRSLASLANGALPPDEVIPLLTQVLDALGAAHARGVVHRDLKPDNIFLIRRGEQDRFVKVLDFGVAKLLSQGPVGSQTMTGMAIGTPSYMAPEQWTGKAVDGRADLYAMGVMSYLLATGKLPFPRGGMLEMLAYHCEKAPEPPIHLNPLVPRAWSEAILRALAKRPEDRFQTAAEMAQAFTAVLDRSSDEPLFAARGVAPKIASVSVGEFVSRATPVPMTPRHTPVPSASSVTPAPMRASSATPAPSEQRATTRFSVQLPARILDGQGNPLFDAICTELSRGGLYVCHSGKAPKVFTRLQVVLVVNGRVLECPCEVVREVNAADAEKWQMAAGFAVQFVNPTAELRETITQILQSVAAMHPGTSVAARLHKVAASDFYAVLELELDATVDAVGKKARELSDLLRSAEKDAPTDVARRQVGEAKQKVDVARAILGDPGRRVDHDVARNNFRGVARCLEAGLTPENLQRVHERYSQTNGYQVNAARLHHISATVWEKRGDLEQARIQYESALRLDPANLALHQALAKLTGAPGATAASKRTASVF